MKSKKTDSQTDTQLLNFIQNNLIDVESCGRDCFFGITRSGPDRWQVSLTGKDELWAGQGKTLREAMQHMRSLKRDTKHVRPIVEDTING